MENKEISPEESLRVIQQMIAESRNKFYNNGFALLFWGILIIAACLGQFILIETGHARHSNYIWPIAIGIGVIVTFVYFRFYARERRFHSRQDANNGILWIGFCITYVVLIYLCINLNINPLGFIWCLLGFGLFASGGIYRFKPFYLGAVVFWICAILTLYIGDNVNELWVGAIAMFIGYIVPGYLLWNKAKREAHV